MPTTGAVEVSAGGFDEHLCPVLEGVVPLLKHSDRRRGSGVLGVLEFQHGTAEVVRGEFDPVGQIGEVRRSFEAHGCDSENKGFAVLGGENTVSLMSHPGADGGDV